MLNGIDLKNLEESVLANTFEFTSIGAKLEKNSEHWLALGKHWLPKIKSNELEILNMKSIIEKFSSHDTNTEPPQDIDSLLNPNLNQLHHQCVINYIIIQIKVNNINMCLATMI